jgi:uncharacterized peroxidase-related enzyme
LRRDHTSAPLGEADRALCDFTVKLTERPHTITPADLDSLRRAGFDDRAILQITLIASWFNYINRVADALGVGKSEMPEGWRP